MNWALLLKIFTDLIPAALSAARTIEKDTGKTPEQAISDTVDHLTPGGTNSPSLS